MSIGDRLFATGYAGHDLDSFLHKLREYQIEVVIDIRQNPVSRKKGFSRSRLCEFLSQHGVEYVHVRPLGVPVDLRKRLREGQCNLQEYFAAYLDYLGGQVEALQEVAAVASSKRCCLLCVEERPEDCHRSAAAEEIAACADAGPLAIAPYFSAEADAANWPARTGSNRQPDVGSPCIVHDLNPPATDATLV